MCFASFALFVRAQTNDCMLGLGGKSTETIIQVFQLNEEQVRKMEEFQAELTIANKVFEDEIRVLFDTHPQSTTEELEKLATQYKLLKDRILENAGACDIRMLELFNPRQYDRYLELCAIAQRTPYQVVPQPFPKTDPK